MLTEHYAGAFPAWLAPVQVVGIPVTDEQVPYLRDVARQLRAAGHPGRGRRLRRPDAEEDPHRQQQKVPFVLHRRGDRRRGRRGVLPLPRRLPAQRRAGGRGRRAGRRLGRRAPRTTSTRPPRTWRRDEPGPGGLPVAVRRTTAARRRSSSGCGRRTGWPTSAARASRTRRARLPVLRHPDAGRRGRADRGPRGDGVRGAQPVPVQPRAPDAGPVPARRRLHRADRPTRSPSWARSRRRRCGWSVRSAARTASTSG